MRFIVALILLASFSTASVAQSNVNKFLLSRGMEIQVIASPDEAAALSHVDEIEAKKTIYLPPGTMAIQIGDSDLQSPNLDYRLLLSETGIWGLFRPSNTAALDHRWVRELTDWAEDMAQVEGSNCPAPTEQNQLLLVFPALTVQAVRNFGSQRQGVTVHPATCSSIFGINAGTDGSSAMPHLHWKAIATRWRFRDKIRTSPS